ncbi:hypothetical protein [Rhodohalobacter sp. 8-1]|uniref:hypothetical protein n=1 Tax=Rhodohalobacter sp. 8-1 TaxID=3131972 RepID=UPI0030EB1522
MSISLILPLILLAAACEQSSFPTTSEETEFSNSETTAFTAGLESAKISGQVAAQLAEVRRLTAPYHDHQIAAEDGWFIPLSPCVENPDLGGMGYHYGNSEYLGDGIHEPLKPEALLYEPQKNGKLRLVAVEYIVPFGEPETVGGAPVQGDQPFLFGQGFDNSPHVGPLGSWTLHVWLWRNNPSGMFAAYNPKVSCDFAF